MNTRLLVVCLGFAVLHAMAVDAPGSGPKHSTSQIMPEYLKDYEAQWAKNPRSANLAWFRDAKFGMFIHFSPASGVDWGKANRSWCAVNGRFTLEGSKGVSKKEYEQFLKAWFDPEVLMDPGARKAIDSFNARSFDAEKIADLAVAAGMKYITFTTRHVCGRMFLFDTEASLLTSVKGRPKRDLVAELARACGKRNLGLFLYVMPPHTDAAIRGNLDMMLTDLLTKYGPVAGIWFDGIIMPYVRPDSFKDLSQVYALVRRLQGQCLISFKTGWTGEEDFLAPEWHFCTYDKKGLPRLNPKIWGGLIKQQPQIQMLWDKTLRYKPVEICTSLSGWFNQGGEVRCKSVEEVLEEYAFTRKMHANYLLNLPLERDGSISSQHVDILRAVGKRLKNRE